MGASKVDFHTTRLQNDVKFAYGRTESIRAMLKNINQIRGFAENGRDPSDFIAILADLEVATQKVGVLSPRQRQVVAAYFTLELTQEETAKMFGVTHRTIGNIADTAVERLTVYMSGQTQGVPYSIDAFEINAKIPASIREYLVATGEGHVCPVKPIDDTLRHELQTYLCDTDDDMLSGMVEAIVRNHTYTYELKYADLTLDGDALDKTEYPSYGGFWKNAHEYVGTDSAPRYRRGKKGRELLFADIFPHEGARKRKRSTAELNGASDKEKSYFDSTKRNPKRIVRDFNPFRSEGYDHAKRWRMSKKYNEALKKSA